MTAAPSPPRCIRRRRRFGGDARHAPRASESTTLLHNKKQGIAKAIPCFWQGQKDLNLLRKPSCGAQNCFCLGAASNFDRCAITASLYPPPAALRRRCPARSACLGEHNPFTQQKTRYRKSDTLFLAGAEGLELASQALLRCPKLLLPWSGKQF